MAGVFLCPYKATAMNIKGIYAGRPAFFQLLVLTALVLFGSTAAGIISLPFLSGGKTTNPDSLRIIQLFASVCMFLLPAFGAAYLFSKNTKQYLSIAPLPNRGTVALTLLSMLLITPVIGVTHIINQAMQLPAFLAPVEQWMRAQEEAMEKMTQLLLEGKGIVTLLFNVLVIAVAAALTEEFIFRGALQRILEKAFRNHHAVIWTAAFLFSAFHLQFYGFIPRMLLGAYFGYLLFWGKTIWLPVLAHFFNNLCGIFTLTHPALAENKILSESAQLRDVLPVAAVCLLLFTGCVWALKRKLASKIFLP